MKVTFEELRQQVALYAAAMRKMGVSRGDRVVGEYFRRLEGWDSFWMRRGRVLTRSLGGRPLRTRSNKWPEREGHCRGGRRGLRVARSAALRPAGRLESRDLCQRPAPPGASVWVWTGSLPSPGLEFPRPHRAGQGDRVAADILF